MRDFYVFDIPFYRTTSEKYYADTDALVEKHVRFCFEEHGLDRPEESDEFLVSLRRRTRERLGGPWDFNQIVGWVRLFLEGYGIGAHIWRADGQRYSRTMPKKTFHLMTMSNCLHPGICRADESNEIFARTLEALEEFAKGKSMRRRYLDLSVFRRIGPYIDWKQLLEQYLERQNEHVAANTCQSFPK